MSIICS